MKKIKYLILLLSFLVIGLRLNMKVHADDTCVHQFGEWVVEQESTCISKGVRYHTCTICNHTEQEVTEYSSHQYDQTITKAQTETEHGEITYTCSVCGDSYVTQMACVPGDWSNPGVSCTEILISIRRCTICNTQLDSKEIDPVGHQYTDWEIITEATCTENGTKQRSCTLCHTEVQTEVINASGHSLVNHPGLVPTCHSFGHVEYEECSKCDYSTYYMIPPDDHFIGENIIYKSTTSYLTLQDIKSLLTNDLITCDCKLRYEVENVNYIGKGNVAGTYFVNLNIYNDSLESVDYPDYVETHLINIIVNSNLKSDYVYKNNLYFRTKLTAEAVVSDMKLLKKVPNVNLATEFRLKDNTKEQWNNVSKTGTYIYDISYIASSGESGIVGVNLNLLAPLTTTTDDNAKSSNSNKIITLILLIVLVVIIIYLIYTLLFKKKRYWRKKK